MRREAFRDNPYLGYFIIYRPRAFYFIYVYTCGFYLVVPHVAIFRADLCLVFTINMGITPSVDLYDIISSWVGPPIPILVYPRSGY